MAWMIPAAIIGSSLIGGSAASSGASQQADATSRAADLQYKMWQEQQANMKPWLDAGGRALGKLETAAEYTPFSYNAMTADPGYAFRISEGQKALERSAAARGGLISGGALKAATRFGQDMGSQEYTNAFNRYQTERAAKLQPLQSLAGVGQTAANTLANAAGAYGSNAADLITGGAAASAAGKIGQANAVTSGLNTYLNYTQNNLLNALNRSRTSYSGGGYSGDVNDFAG